MRIHFNQNNGSYSALDMGSKNGVIINGVKIDKETVLNDGDYIAIGNTRLMFTVKDFFDRRSAQAHAKQAGQREYPTQED
jgi:pSer/pThr/pTyr-binding forkhead associated (FHA) protein